MCPNNTPDAQLNLSEKPIYRSENVEGGMVFRRTTLHTCNTPTVARYDLDDIFMCAICQCRYTLCAALTHKGDPYWKAQ